MEGTTSLKAHKHNDLIQARYSALSMHEQLLLLAVMGLCDPRQLTAETPVELTVSAFRDLVDTNSTSVYSELKEAVKRLYNRSVIIAKPDPDDPSLTETETRWISSINYYEGEGRIRLYFAPKIIPYLANLNGNYTSFFIRHVANFKSGYGVRLYELLVQWQSKGSREIEIDWLRKAWGLECSYKAMCDFKKRVIDPAMQDINQHSNLWVKIGQRKRGRRVVAFQFQFGLKQPEPPTKPKPIKNKSKAQGFLLGFSKAELEKNARPGESYEDVARRLRS